MELLNAVILKFQAALFVALVMAIANDDCQMTRSDEERKCISYPIYTTGPPDYTGIADPSQHKCTV